jgi:hypothetical protein
VLADLSQANERSFASARDVMADIAESTERSFASARDVVSKIVDVAQVTLANFSATRVAAFADGGLVTGPTRALIGEAGRELILPLTRPDRMTQLLSMPGIMDTIARSIDPSQLLGHSDFGRAMRQLADARYPSDLFPVVPQLKSFTPRPSSPSDGAIVSEVRALRGQVAMLERELARPNVTVEQHTVVPDAALAQIYGADQSRKTRDFLAGTWR